MPDIIINNSNEITNTVNVPQQSRGAGTVLLVVFLWPVLLMWWQILATAWLLWLIIAVVVTIWDHEFFSRTWYYPWPAWMFGIR